jgi:hypothetical protein
MSRKVLTAILTGVSLITAAASARGDDFACPIAALTSAAGFVLTNNGVGSAPTYQAVVTGVSGQASGKLAIGGSATTITSNKQ